MTARNPVRAKDRQHQSRFTRPILFVFPTSGTCISGVAPRDNVLWASAEQQETRAEATEVLRGLVNAIILTRSQGELRIELKGNLAAMLSAATNATRSPETGDLSLHVEMVAGACNRRYLQLWSGAA